jgi:hypothetical protein
MPLHVNVSPTAPSVYGIVLEPTETPGEFHRCGVFCVANMCPAEHWVERLGEVLKIGSVSTAFGPPVGRNETMGRKQYEVTLV